VSPSIRIAALAASFLAVPSFAQSTFGSFVGTVRDPSGGFVADCIVTLINTGTSVRRSTVTDKDGNYVLVNIEPGAYQIGMQSPGFQAATYSNLQLLSRQTVRIDGTLSLATQVESVNVNAASELVISTEVSNIAHTQTGRELFDLPVAIGSRASGSTSAMSTLSTQAGVQVDNAGAISVAGSKPSMLSISVDGISTMSVRNNAPIAELFPSFGTIAEIRVSEINNAAEFGGVSDITTVSKGGTNALHGGVFENLQNTALNARNPFSAAKTKTIMNNYGAFAGGPIVKDKTFFFASYEGLKLPRQRFISQSVPSLALREGNLSAYTRVLDPTTGAPFPGNQIPLTRISPIALNALTYLWPLPNTGAPNAIANNYSTNFATPISSNQGDVRVDQNLGARQTLFVRGTYKEREVDDPPTAATQTVLAGAIHRPERVYSVTLAHNFVISPTIVNELRLGISDHRQLTSTDFSAPDIIAKVGVQVPDPPSGSQSPTFTINGFAATGSQGSAVSRSKTLQLLDNVTWTRGSHTVKVGGDIRRLSAYFSNVFSADRAGRYTFNGSVTNPLVGNPYGAFLLGIPDRTGIGLVNVADSDGSATHYAFYVQDDWKATKRLTINYGMRWEFHPPFRDALNNLAAFMPDVYTAVGGTLIRGGVVVPDDGYALTHPGFAATIAPTPILTASQAGVPQTLHRSQRSSFAPRIGFAWRATADGKTVIRGGYGRFIETMLGTLTSAGWAVSASSITAHTNTIVNGRPTLTFPYPFPANLSLPGTQDFRVSADINYRDPYVQQWNFTFERDLGFSTGVRFSYDGSHGSNLGYTKNLAQVPANTAGFAIAKAASPFPLWARISHETTGARSNYHALTIAANKRMSRGLMFQSSYSFAKNLSNGQGFNPTAYATQAGGTVTDPYNIDLDYGNVAFTRRHRFLNTFLYELPFGTKGMMLTKANKVVDQIVGGWQLSGVLLFQSGPFMTVVAPGADPAGNNFPNLESAARADSVSGAPLYPANRSLTQWINPGAFAIPANNIGRAGNSSVGSVVGPGTQAVSLSLFKTFPVRESIRFQLGAAASNFFNHPNYTVPNLNLGTEPFGSITNVQTQESGGPRAFQITGRISF
jgi:hypothetical protein